MKLVETYNGWRQKRKGPIRTWNDRVRENSEDIEEGKEVLSFQLFRGKASVQKAWKFYHLVLSPNRH